METLIVLLFLLLGSAGLYVDIIFLLIGVISIIYDFLYGKEKQRIYKYKSPLNYYEKRKDIGYIMNRFALYGVTLLILFCIVAEINMFLGEYCYVLARNVNDIESMLLAYIGVVVSVLILSVTLGTKEYYLTVTQEEVNRHYRIGFVFQVLGLCSVSSIICMIFLQECKLERELDWFVFACYQVLCILIFLFGAYAMWIVGMLAMGSSRMENYSLDSLHRIFHNNAKLDITGSAEDAINRNLGYFINEYIKLISIKPKVLSKVENIEFCSDISYSEKWLKLSIRITTIILTICNAVSIACCIVVQAWRWLSVTIILYILCVCLVNMCKSIRKYISNLVLCNRGFLVKFKNEEKYIGINSLYYSAVWKKYIVSVENMMALYCILCTCENTEKVIVNSLKDMVAFLDEKKCDYVEYTEALYYLPVFVCAYYGYEKYGEKSEVVDVLKELYRNFSLNEEEENRYKTAINSFIWFAHEYRPSDKDREYARKGQLDVAYYNEYIVKNQYWSILTEDRS